MIEDISMCQHEDRNRNKMEMNILGKNQAALLLVKEFPSPQDIKNIALEGLSDSLHSGTISIENFLATENPLKLQGFASGVYRLFCLTD